MRRSYSGLEEEEEDQFFDSREDITSVSDSGSDCADNAGFGSAHWNVDWVSSSLPYDVWTKNPDSVDERRGKFLKWLGMGSDQQARVEDFGDQSGIELSVEVDRIREDTGAVLAHSDCEAVLSSSRSSGSCSSSDSQDSCEGEASEVNMFYKIKNLDDGTEFIVDQLGRDGMLSRLREVGSNRLLSIEEFHNSLGLTSLVHQCSQREAKGDTNVPVKTTKRVKSGWLRRLGVVACGVDRQIDDDCLKPTNSFLSTVVKVPRVRVHSSKKRTKELSALYNGQEIQAHRGSILSMKFSPDGCYLASAGEDRVIRIWKVMEIERLKDVDIPDYDPSSLYFVASRHFEVASLSSDKEKLQKYKGRRTSDSACAIFPSRVFRLSEKPLHEFHGHTGEILDLSWSKSKHLLSSSVDNTVRLWQVGCDQCLRVYHHNNFVTCIQFNPLDDNYFISGSIDGKIRIWDVAGCCVVDWTDIKEIVTAVCYRPDGKGGIVGSMTGNCRFYDVTENRLQLEAQICLQGKKKSPGKRITGFQFAPNDPNKLMVTSADSHIRILNGLDVICKYKGFRNAGSQISASFTVDGKHIVSASEDSNVCVWNHKCQDGPSRSQGKSIRSREHFFSSNVSVATPWFGMRDDTFAIPTLGTHLSYQLSGVETGWPLYQLKEPQPASPPDCLSLNQSFFSEVLPKGSATWPEENLPASNPMPASSVVCKTQYKFLKSFYQSTSSHAWGQVIVTGGWDGRICAFHNYGLPVHT